MTYQAYGSVRGSCGHAHRTAYAAWQCAQSDGRSIDRKNSSGSLSRAYSDRYVRHSDGTTLSEYEIELLDQTIESAMKMF